MTLFGSGKMNESRSKRASQPQPVLFFKEAQ